MTELFHVFDPFPIEPQVPQNSILSRTLLDTPVMKLVLFHFAAGQALSEHTASMPAIIQILSGEAELTLGEESRQVNAGAFIYMTAHLKHAVNAKTPLVMLLQLLKAEH
jgi:quercetin dioxygenase-like cupin family protein